MKNFSSITENLDITTKKYVDDNKVTSIDGLSGGTLTSQLKISGGDQSTASKISLNQSANGQITDSNTSTLFGFMSSTTLTVGSKGYALALRGSGTRPTYKDADLALYSDIPTVPTDYIKYTAQTLTDAQKSQARSNIGAGTSSFSGSYNDLTDKPTIPDVSGKANLSGGNTFTGNQTFTGEVTFNNKINLGQGDANCLYLGSDGRLNGPGNRTLLRLVSGATALGHQAYSLHLRGSAARPQYTTDDSNYKDLALYSDIPTFSLSGTTLTITL